MVYSQLPRAAVNSIQVYIHAIGIFLRPFLVILML